MEGIILAALVGAVVLIGAFVVFAHLARERRAFREALNLRLLLVRMPLGGESREQDALKEVGLTEQLIASLASLKKPFALELAVRGTGEEINFYIAAPHSTLESVKRLIQGVWKGVEVAEADEYTIFHSSGATLGVSLGEKEHYALPIRTYDEVGHDTFSPILNAFSNVHLTNEGLALQLVVKPAPSSAGKTVSRLIGELKAGKKLGEVLGEERKGAWKQFAEIVGGKEKKKEEDPTQPKPPPVIEEQSVKALEAKIARPLFSVNVRVAVSAEQEARASELLDGVLNSFQQFSAPYRNEFVFRRVPRRERFTPFIFRLFDESRAMTLSSSEIASFFHFPISTTHVPKVSWVRFREAPPPLTLLPEGLYLGESVFRGARAPVFIGPEDRRRHLYIIGQTGTGKSNLMNLLAQSDMKNGQGLAVIDPHGDLVDAIAGSVPRERYNDVIIFNPGDLERPLGMNMLEYDPAHPEQKTFIMNELYGILDKLYDLKVVGGPMFEQYMKNAVLLLMEDAVNEPATLVELARVFTDEEFRNRKLARISNPLVVDFWEKEAAQATGEHSLQNMASWITSKFNAFIANDYVRPIVSQTTSSFNFREIMDQGKILLVNLSKGRIGDVNANLMGMIVAGKILMAALSRTDVPEAERRDFHVYIDEFQNFTTDSIGVIFSEARKYRLTLTVAHQFIAQLTDKVRESVFGNVGTVVAFRVGAPDAEFLEKQFAPTLSKQDLANVDNLNAYIRLLVGGRVVPPFNIHTPFAERGNPELRERLKELSRTTYGRDRREVEEALTRRLRE